MSASRVAVVSGGTRGLGRAITDYLLADGWSVLATFLSDTATAEAVTGSHPRLSVLRADTSSSVDCQRTTP